MIMTMDYETLAFTIKVNLDRVLYSLQTMNSYISSRDNYRVLLDEGVLDPTCFTDLDTNIKTLTNYLTEQTKELQSLQNQNHILLCRLILKMTDMDLESLVDRCDSMGVRFTAQELIMKSVNKGFSSHEYAILSLLLSSKG